MGGEWAAYTGCLRPLSANVARMGETCSHAGPQVGLGRLVGGCEHDSFAFSFRFYHVASAACRAQRLDWVIVSAAGNSPGATMEGIEERADCQPNRTLSYWPSPLDSSNYHLNHAPAWPDLRRCVRIDLEPLCSHLQPGPCQLPVRV